MTVDGRTPYGDASASAVVAESLSAVGYAMFAWLQTGPLEQIPSMSEFRAQFAPEAPAQPEHPAYQGDPEDGVTFGVAEVGEDLAAVTQQPEVAPEVVLAPAAPVAASSAQVVLPVPGAPVPLGVPAESVSDGVVEPVAQPPVPVTLPEYTKNQTLQMLQEISFLDE